jgi:hypothetical protein
MEATVAQSCNAGLSRGYTISEDIIAVFGAIPSSIMTYVLLQYDALFNSSSPITYLVLAIAIGSTIALHFEALRLLVSPDKYND